MNALPRMEERPDAQRTPAAPNSATPNSSSSASGPPALRWEASAASTSSTPGGILQHEVSDYISKVLYIVTPLSS
jgi:hypothetical protein